MWLSISRLQESLVRHNCKLIGHVSIRSTRSRTQIWKGRIRGKDDSTRMQEQYLKPQAGWYP